MSEPRQKRRAISSSDDELILDDENDVQETATSLFVDGVKTMNVEKIRQALARGADSYERIGDEQQDPILYMVNIMKESPRPPNSNMWNRFMQSANTIMEAGHVMPQYSFDSEVFQIALVHNFAIPMKYFKPRWAGDDRIADRTDFWKRFIIALHSNSEILRSLETDNFNNSEYLSSYPAIAIQRIVFGLLAQHDTLSDEKVRFLCSIEPEPNYERQFAALQKMLQGLGSRQGLFTLAEVPYRYWMSLVMAYLYGVTSMQNNEFAIMIPYVIQTGVIPVAGHVERVKYLPDFAFLDEILEELRSRLAEVAQKCHNDPRVRSEMESRLLQ